MITNKELAEELSKYKELDKKFEVKMQELEKRIKKVEDENKELKEEISGLNKNSSDRPLFNNWVTAVVNGSKEKPKEKPREQHLVLNACDLELRNKRKELNDHLKSDSPFRYGIRGNELCKIKKQ